MICFRSKLCVKCFSALPRMSLVNYVRYILWPSPPALRQRVASTLSLPDSIPRNHIPSQTENICSYMLPSNPAPPSVLSMTHADFAFSFREPKLYLTCSIAPLSPAPQPKPVRHGCSLIYELANKSPTGGWERGHKVRCSQRRFDQQCPVNKEVTVDDVLQLQSNTLPPSFATWPDSQTGLPYDPAHQPPLLLGNPPENCCTHPPGQTHDRSVPQHSPCNSFDGALSPVVSLLHSSSAA